MSYHRQTNDGRKSDNYNSMQNIDQLDIRVQESTRSTTTSSTQRPSYPIVPKRAQPSASSSQHSISNSIPTTSRIHINPSSTQTNSHLHPSLPSSSPQHVHHRPTLDLITKYTSPLEHLHHLASEPVQTRLNQPMHFPKIKLKNKRTLSPSAETSKQSDSIVSVSKRPKAFFKSIIDEDDDDDDDDAIEQLLDCRRNKYVLTQKNHTSSTTTTSSSQSTTIDTQERKPTVRKPTVRKTSVGRQTPAMSPPMPVEQPVVQAPIELEATLLIEPDTDTEDDDMSVVQETSEQFQECQSSNDKYASDTTIEENSNQSLSTMLLVKSTNSMLTVSTRNAELSTTQQSPSRQSLSSSLFETPRSSLSRTTTEVTPQMVIKTGSQIESSPPSIMQQLITQTKLRVQNNDNKVNYDPIDLINKLFREYVSFSSNENLTTTKQRLLLGRYEIETIFPSDNNKISTIYACDLCLKHFHGSSIASQRHAGKCTSTRPPGKLVYETDDLGIFQIGETSMNIEQRIYIQSLYRIARLFLNFNANIDRFVYYILCRKDPIVSSYRLVGYFTKQLYQYNQQPNSNLTHLFILPSYSHHRDYKQMLIAYSYFLLPNKHSSLYTSPTRPLDKTNLLAFRTYWREIVLAYIINQIHSPLNQITLDKIVRHTLIHPRDILSTLHFDGLIVSYSTEKSTVRLLIDHPLYIKQLKQQQQQNQSQLFLDTTTMVVDNDRIDKNNDSGIEEIVLD